MDDLASDEIRFVRDRLNAIDLFQDICPALPVELLIQVATHLHLEDIFRFRSVSRSWLAAFSSSDFCFGMIKHHFPRKAPSADLAPESKEEFPNRIDSFEYFRAISFTRLRRKHGIYTSETMYNYCFPHDINFPESQPQYCNGRAAFKTHEYGIIVQDLKTGISTHYFEPQRAFIYKVVYNFWMGPRAVSRSAIIELQ